MATISPSASSPPSDSSSEPPSPPPPEPSSSAPPPSNSDPPPAPPLSTSTPPPQPPSDPPTTTSPPSQSNTDPPPPTTSTPSTPSLLPPPPPPPPPSAIPPPLVPPTISTQPPSDSVSPSSPAPPSSTTTPPSSTSNPPPPLPSNPPKTSPPPPSNPPEISPPPPPQSKPPENSLPPVSPQSKPPESSPPPPPPPPSNPPESSPQPPPQSKPPKTSLPQPPLSSEPPETSPPPPDARAPKNSTPPPKKPPSPILSNPPKNSPPPQTASEPPSSSNAPPPSKLTPISPSISTSKTSPPPPPLSSQSNNGMTNAPETSNPTSNSTNGGGGFGLGGIVAMAIVSGMILLGLFGLAAWCFRKQKKKPGVGIYVMPSPLGSSPRSDSYLIKVNSSAPLGSESGCEFSVSPPDPSSLGHSRSLFTYEELAKATDGFLARNLLGEGGFGSVYKGFLPDEREVAVKELKIGGGQGEREFKAEVETISRVHHRHLVSLVGYCISENRRLLVYDYVPNNNLYYHIHEEGKPALDWQKRVKIATGAARGIAYLHEDCNPQIIHRDIKSSNILLNYNLEALVSDFGLAKLALDSNTHITTRVMGTFGYVAPEYASSGKLTEKSDVYSFGVVLLELITGRKPVDTSQPVGDESLVEWARPLLSHALETEQFEELADPRLERNYDKTEMFKMIEIAASCVRHSAAKRPRMGQVVRAFDCLDTLDLTNKLAVGESKTFDTAEQSAEIRLFQRMAFGSQPYSTDFFSQDYSTA